MVGLGVDEVSERLEELMGEMDAGYFCEADRSRSEAFWRQYLAPEVEALFSPEVEFHSHFKDHEGRRVFRGHEGLWEWAQEVNEIFSRFERENEEWVRRLPGGLVLRQRIRAVGRESGASIDVRIWVSWLLDGEGRVREMVTFSDCYEALAAIGAGVDSTSE
jgi:hypothetical protein